MKTARKWEAWGYEGESWLHWSKWVVGMQEESLEVQSSLVSCFLSCLLFRSANTQYFSLCAQILSLQLRTLPLESGSAEQVPMLSLSSQLAGSSDISLQASAVEVIPTAALALVVCIPALSTEGLSNLPCCIFFFLSQINADQSILHSFVPSIQQNLRTTLVSQTVFYVVVIVIFCWWCLWRECAGSSSSCLELLSCDKQIFRVELHLHPCL